MKNNIQGHDWLVKAIFFFIFVFQCGCGNPLQKSITRGNEKKIASYLKKNQDLNQTFRNGTTPLTWATIYKHKSIIDMLLNRGADINRGDAYLGYTPLLAATRRNDLEISKHLLERGAYVDCRAFGFKLISYRFLGNGIMYEIEKNTDGKTPLILAIANKNIELVRLLLDHGATLNYSVTYDNMSPLMGEYKSTTIQIDNWKSAYGSKPPDKEGVGTPLTVAVEISTVEIVKLLLENGADVNQKDGKGLTALEIAKKEGRKEIVDLLTKYKN